MKLQSRIAQAISEATGQAAVISDTRTAHGGCINDSRVLTLQDGRRFFVKTHPAARRYPGLFQAEFEALHRLFAADAVRVPEPLTCTDDFIVMEFFSEGPPARDWHEQIGRQLALLHQATQHDQFGFGFDNYLGTTPQPNRWTPDWLSFWRDQRLGWQLELYSRSAAAGDEVLKLGERLLGRLLDYLAGIDEPAVLLHGDLWSGNAASDDQGRPVIFDPASYYGHREAEIGMMRMFGGFGTVCEAAYAEVWPLAPGSEERISLYRLYHELNHLNLFGQGYHRSCVSTMRQLL
ncbi:MAG: fructosamine kinase family protein [Thiotrichales bacterium]|nr:fructosamine kinase family protein [Thiotrichales bacterium]